ncbi:MAG: regulatory protein GemA [Pseudomonadota bacterium]
MIHIARKDLVMDEATYRMVIRTVGRAASGSSADLSTEGRRLVLAHFRACGWKPKASPTKRRPARSEQDAKILALWGELERMGVLRVPGDKGLDGFIKRQVGVDAREFLRPRHKQALIEALKNWVAREKAKGDRA